MTDIPTTHRAIAPDVRYVIPRIVSSFPSEVHPLYDRTVASVNARFRPFLLDYFEERESDSRRTDKFLGQSHPYWGALCFPHILEERFFGFMTWMLATSLVDDSFADPRIHQVPGEAEALKQSYVALLRGEPYAENRRTRALAAAVSHYGGPSSQAVIDRMLRALVDVIESSLRELQGGVSASFADMDTYLRFRRTNVYGEWLKPMTEWGLGIDLDERATEAGTLRHLHDLVIDHWILVNDIFSFPKELEAGEDMNCVFLLMDRENLSLQQSLDHAAALAMATEQEFVTARGTLATDHLPPDHDVRRYLLELEHMISGNLQFHRWTSRYHGYTRTDRQQNGSAEQTSLYRRGDTHNPL
ncbi:hypothetical protein ACFWF7_38980 [Nocardia sp. NPDC060256]|uniref:terpene synthase family protein n=1 Tax=unclassified Nocardia TaxID=2637762 RepID=UPI003648CCB2